MKRRVWMFLLTLTAALALLTVTALAADVSDLKYQITKKQVTITGCSTSASGELVIPQKIEGYPVTKIEKYAFSDCSRLTSVTMPDTITETGGAVFYGCTSLKSVTLSNQIDSLLASYYDGGYDDTITTGYFEGCISLKSVTIPSSVTYIGSRAFANCESLTSVTIPNSVTEAGGGVFYHCTALESVTLSENLTELSYDDHVIDDEEWDYYGFFEDCTSLKSVIIPNSVRRIDELTFAFCESLTSITIPDSVTVLGKSAFRDCTALESVTLSENLDYLGSYLFSDCSSLRSVTIPNGVKDVFSNVFANCSNLESVTIGSGLEYLSSDAFPNCSKLQQFQVHPDNKSYSSADGILFDKEQTSLKRLPGGRTVLDSLPSTVTRIGDSSCACCSELSSVILPDSVTEIGEHAFQNCTKLSSVAIPDGLKKIEEGAFIGCTGLTKVEITDLAAWCEISFGDNPLDYAKNLYLNGKPVTKLVIPDGVTKIPARAFYRCESLTSVTIPEGVTSIGSSAFRHCTGVTSVTLPRSVTSIGTRAFGGCSGLADVNYGGMPEKWETVTIGAGNEPLTDAAMHYALQITTQPKNAFVKAEDTASFTVNAAGSGLTYQWQYLKPNGSWTNCTSATTGYNKATLKVQGVTGSTNRNGYQYRCKVTDSAGNKITSGAVTLSVLSITAQPVSATIAGGGTASFQVAATGSGLTYQWQYKTPDGAWKNCTSATTGYHSATLQVQGVTGSTNRNGYQYRCVITDSAGNKVTSSAATLTVKVLSITTQPKSASVKTTAYAAFTVKASGAGLTYQWQYKTPDGAWKNCTSATTGYRTATLQVQGVTGSTNRNGYQYRCKVTDSSGAVVFSNAAKLNVLAITTQPKNTSTTAGKHAAFTAAATGAGLTYQWQYKTPDGGWKNCTSATTGYHSATLQVQGVTGSTNRNGYQYRCVITDSAGNKITTSAAKLSVK